MTWFAAFKPPPEKARTLGFVLGHIPSGPYRRVFVELHMFGRVLAMGVGF